MTWCESLPPTATRVNLATEPLLNEAIRQADDDRIAEYAVAEPERLDNRLAQLDEEWDVERILQVNSSLFALLGVFLTAGGNKAFKPLPGVIYGFLLMHALKGWCPPLPLLRRAGKRTVAEIERERYALKALRGDFDKLPRGRKNPDARAKAVLKAIDL